MMEQGWFNLMNGHRHFVEVLETNGHKHFAEVLQTNGQVRFKPRQTNMLSSNTADKTKQISTVHFSIIYKHTAVKTISSVIN